MSNRNYILGTREPSGGGIVQDKEITNIAWSGPFQ